MAEKEKPLPIKEMSATEARLRIAHMLHRLVSLVRHIQRKEEVEDFEVGSMHDDIYKLLERPDL